MALTRRELDRMTCGEPHPEGEKCDHEALYFHGVCHMESPTWSVYENGVLSVICAECRKNIVSIQVAV